MSEEEESKSQSLMQRLREQAEARRKLEQERTNARKSDQEFYAEVTRPAMLATYEFLRELVSHVEYLEEKIEVSYDIPGLGKIEKLVQSGYSLRADTLGDITSIKLKFICEAPWDYIKEVRGVEQVRLAIRSLERIGMIFSRTDERLNNGIVEEVRLSVSQRFSVMLHVSVDMEGRNIIFRFRNFEGYGDRVRKVDPAMLNENELDELAKYILREPSRWAVTQLDEKQREDLRRQLEADRKKKGRFGGLFR